MDFLDIDYLSVDSRRGKSFKSRKSQRHSMIKDIHEIKHFFERNDLKGISTVLFI